MGKPNLIFQDSHFVGYIKQVTPRFVIVHFPSSTLLKKFYLNAEALQAGIVGNYILIEGEDHGFLGQIVEISLPEKERMILTQTAFEKDNFHPFAKAEVLLSFNFYELKAQKGISQLPPIGSKVFVCPSQMLLGFLHDFGRSTQYPDEPVFKIATLPHTDLEKIGISPQALLGRHCAIVGTTGSGKSYTVTTLLEKVIEHNGKAILFDPTGEYETLKKNSKVKYITLNDEGSDRTFFHYSNLKETDFYAIFRPAPHLQLPKLQESFKSLRLVKLLSEKKNKEQFEIDVEAKILKGHLIKTGLDRNKLQQNFKANPEVDSLNCDIDIKELGYQLFFECIYENDYSNPELFGQRNEKDLGLCFTLITRINLALKNSHFINVFGIEDKPEDSDSFINIYENYVKNKEHNLLIIAFNKVPTENNLKSVLMNAFGNFFLDKALKKEFKFQPLVLFLDEAHLFLNRNVKDEYSIEIQLNAFERIAKECRKFGLFLALSTQLPRDIPVGILSQFGTFLVHRLINQNDREVIEFACSEATKSALAFLPILMPGQALLTGVDFPMPVVLQIERPQIEPDSRTPQIFGNKQ